VAHKIKILVVKSRGSSELGQYESLEKSLGYRWVRDKVHLIWVGGIEMRINVHSLIVVFRDVRVYDDN
jgi:hypothetical protein